MGAGAWGTRLTRASGPVLRYALVLIVLWIGLFKFTPSEAEGIEPLLRHSPLLSWMYAVMSVRSASAVIGTAEVLIALLIALRPLSPRLAAAGSIGAIGMFLTTLSFLFTTPGMFKVVDGLFVPSGMGSFVIKDLVLLGAALWLAGEALTAAAGPRAVEAA